VNSCIEEFQSNEAISLLQLCLFAHSRYKHVNYTWDNRISFSHLFLKGWDAIREVNSYPPSIGPLAVYKIDEFYETIDYAVIGVSQTCSTIMSFKRVHRLWPLSPHLLSIMTCIWQCIGHVAIPGRAHVRFYFPLSTWVQFFPPYGWPFYPEDGGNRFVEMLVHVCHVTAQKIHTKKFICFPAFWK